MGEREKEKETETGVRTAADYNDLSDRAIISTIIRRSFCRGNGKPPRQHFHARIESRPVQHVNKYCEIIK